MPSVRARGETPAAERRLVSVLFLDLVGFTTLSESRDPEDVRELLSGYFDTCRTIVVRYGGAVEKFIGDAVMAVWGTPVAQEDDAERAVRAALDLTDAVVTLGAGVGAPDLRARAGVLTGEAAVTIGAEGEGMVAGDLVNTASRIQSVAEPGTVYVGESTRRATEAAIVYDDTGSHDLKGKIEPVPLWRALRVVAGVRGALKSEGLEAPFTGRDRELRLVKELFHDSAEGGTVHLVSVIGIAGIGKSRLAWEFYKYSDGLSDLFRWHRGRCLAYGEGVTYWALAEMVRGRAEILEGEDPSSAQGKLHAAVERYVPDPEEQRWVEPRLAHLIGLEERTARDKEDLFAAWRLFFERMAEDRPVIVAFEDMQWADASLLDFIEYLLEWSRTHPIFILTLARPELLERRPSWGAGKRHFTSLFLEPLAREAMEELLAGLVPGLAEDLRARILERAEGVPLYAVETVRMLLDRGLLVKEGNEYRVAGRIETLDVPETLHALIAARLDGLTVEERRLIQDAAVVGKTFTKQALSSVTGLPEEQLGSVLASLVRKEVLSIQADPRSPERGQYGFLQDLVKWVAYETLSKRERKTKHVAVASYLEQAWGSDEEEIVEVVASHYLDAFRAVPDAPDAAEIKDKARDMLARAGERAASLAANEEAQRYFEQAAELTDEPLARGTLLERAGQMAWSGARSEAAAAHFRSAIDLFEREGRTHPAARVAARLGEVEWRAGRLDEALERMEEAFQVLSVDPPDEDLARLAAELGRLHFFRGNREMADERVAVSLQIAETLWLPELIAQSLITKGLMAQWQSRPEESLGLLKHGLDVALENDVPSAALRAYGNLSENFARRDRYRDALDLCLQGLSLARRVGARWQEWFLIGNASFPLVQMGRWDEALTQAQDVLEASVTGLAMPWPIEVAVHRGDLEEAERLLDLMSGFAAASDVQDRTGYLSTKAAVLLAEGRYEEAHSLAGQAFAARGDLGIAGEDVKAAFVRAAEASMALGDLQRVGELVREVEGLKPGELPPYLGAQAVRFRARLEAAREGAADRVEAGFKSAAGMFLEVGVPFWLAVTLLEYGEWLLSQGRDDEARPHLEEARQTFERLKAHPWLERLMKTARVPAERP